MATTVVTATVTLANAATVTKTFDSRVQSFADAAPLVMDMGNKGFYDDNNDFYPPAYLRKISIAIVIS